MWSNKVVFLELLTEPYNTKSTADWINVGVSKYPPTSAFADIPFDDDDESRPEYETQQDFYENYVPDFEVSDGVNFDTKEKWIEFIDNQLLHFYLPRPSHAFPSYIVIDSGGRVIDSSAYGSKIVDNQAQIVINKINSIIDNDYNHCDNMICGCTDQNAANTCTNDCNMDDGSCIYENSLLYIDYINYDCDNDACEAAGGDGYLQLWLNIPTSVVNTEGDDINLQDVGGINKIEFDITSLNYPVNFDLIKFDISEGLTQRGWDVFTVLNSIHLLSADMGENLVPAEHFLGNLIYSSNDGDGAIDNILSCLTTGTMLYSLDVDFAGGCDLDDDGAYVFMNSDQTSIYYNIDREIYSFQIQFPGAVVTNILGGAAEATGFYFQISGDNNDIALGVALWGGNIPAGCGTLIDIELAGETTGITNLIFESAEGDQYHPINASPGGIIDLNTGCNEDCESCSPLTWMEIIFGCTDQNALNTCDNCNTDDGSCTHGDTYLQNWNYDSIIRELSVEYVQESGVYPTFAMAEVCWNECNSDGLCFYYPSNGYFEVSPGEYEYGEGNELFIPGNMQGTIQKWTAELPVYDPTDDVTVVQGIIHVNYYFSVDFDWDDIISSNDIERVPDITGMDVCVRYDLDSPTLIYKIPARNIIGEDFSGVRFNVTENLWVSSLFDGDSMYGIWPAQDGDLKIYSPGEESGGDDYVAYYESNQWYGELDVLYSGSTYWITNQGIYEYTFLNINADASPSGTIDIPVLDWELLREGCMDDGFCSTEGIVEYDCCEAGGGGDCGTCYRVENLPTNQDAGWKHCRTLNLNSFIETDVDQNTLLFENSGFSYFESEWRGHCEDLYCVGGSKDGFSCITDYTGGDGNVGCPGLSAFNFNDVASTQQSIPGTQACFYILVGCMDDGDCTSATCGYISPYYGIQACNYDSAANYDDGSCLYACEASTPAGDGAGCAEYNPNWNCDGICQADVDCYYVCGGGSYFYDCDGIECGTLQPETQCQNQDDGTWDGHPSNQAYPGGMDPCGCEGTYGTEINNTGADDFSCPVFDMCGICVGYLPDDNGDLTIPAHTAADPSECPCPADEFADCDNICWDIGDYWDTVGDGYCYDGYQDGYANSGPNFYCETFNYDEGDCWHINVKQDGYGNAFKGESKKYTIHFFENPDIREIMPGLYNMEMPWGDTQRGRFRVGGSSSDPMYPIGYWFNKPPTPYNGNWTRMTNMYQTATGDNDGDPPSFIGMSDMIYVRGNNNNIKEKSIYGWNRRLWFWPTDYDAWDYDHGIYGQWSESIIDQIRVGGPMCHFAWDSEDTGQGEYQSFIITGADTDYHLEPQVCLGIPNNEQGSCRAWSGGTPSGQYDFDNPDTWWFDRAGPFLCDSIGPFGFTTGIGDTNVFPFSIDLFEPVGNGCYIQKTGDSDVCDTIPSTWDAIYQPTSQEQLPVWVGSTTNQPEGKLGWSWGDFFPSNFEEYCPESNSDTFFKPSPAVICMQDQRIFDNYVYARFSPASDQRIWWDFDTLNEYCWFKGYDRAINELTELIAQDGDLEYIYEHKYKPFDETITTVEEIMGPKRFDRSLSTPFLDPEADPFIGNDGKWINMGAGIKNTNVIVACEKEAYGPVIKFSPDSLQLIHIENLGVCSYLPTGEISSCITQDFQTVELRNQGDYPLDWQISVYDESGRAREDNDGGRDEETWVFGDSFIPGDIISEDAMGLNFDVCYGTGEDYDGDILYQGDIWNMGDIRKKITFIELSSAN